jgi:hypothetical protein
MLLLTACATVEKYSLTYRLWDNDEMRIPRRLNVHETSFHWRTREDEVNSGIWSNIFGLTLSQATTDYIDAREANQRKLFYRLASP